MSHFCIVGAFPLSLSNFQGGLISRVILQGHRVTALAGPATGEEVAAIRKLGAEFLEYPVQRSGMNPLRDIRTLLALRRLFREVRPDVVMCYTIKPVIWGGLALRGVRSPRFFAVITGLGYSFHGRGLVRRALTGLVTRLYRASLTRAERVIFQNLDNRDEFLSRHIVAAEKCHVGRGSGVDLRRFEFSEQPASGAAFLMIARLLREKGLREYAEAARIVRQRHPDTEFRLLGPADPSPDGIPLDEVEGWHEQGCVRYLGAADDVRPHIRSCHIFVLPSYHEGVPRSVVEAMAMGRPILTTDVPGCRETVVSGVNGFLVPKGDSNALAERMIWFIDNREKWAPMGLASRRLAEERFDVRKISVEMTRIMGLRPGSSA